MYRYLIVSCVFIFSGISQILAQNIEVSISNIRNNKGNIVLAIFTNQQQFANEKPIKEEIFDKSSVKNGVMKVKFNLPLGNYAIALLDDEDKNGDMKYNFLGAPLEGFGFSNYVSSGLSKPKYSDFNFDVKKGKNKIDIQVRYIL
jgi:uncharacterized protein (DUF2141 family)